MYIIFAGPNWSQISQCPSHPTHLFCFCFSPNAFNLQVPTVTNNIQHPAARPLPSNTRMKSAHTKPSCAGRRVGSNQLRRIRFYLETQQQMAFNIFPSSCKSYQWWCTKHTPTSSCTILHHPTASCTIPSAIGWLFGHVPTVVSPTRVSHGVRTKVSSLQMETILLAAQSAQEPMTMPTLDSNFLGNLQHPANLSRNAIWHTTPWFVWITPADFVLGHEMGEGSQSNLNLSAHNLRCRRNE